MSIFNDIDLAEMPNETINFEDAGPATMFKAGVAFDTLYYKTLDGAAYDFETGALTAFDPTSQVKPVSVCLRYMKCYVPCPEPDEEQDDTAAVPA